MVDSDNVLVDVVIVYADFVIVLIDFVRILQVCKSLSKLSSSGVALINNVPTNLPSVKADPQRLAQILTNLLGESRSLSVQCLWYRGRTKRTGRLTALGSQTSCCVSQFCMYW